MCETKVVNVKVPADLHKAAKAKASLLGITLEESYKIALEQWVGSETPVDPDAALGSKLLRYINEEQDDFIRELGQKFIKRAKKWSQEEP